MEWKILLIPIIGFIIGYSTNWIALVMLFHPHRKILGLQGVIPKRKDLLAKNIAVAIPEIMPPYFKHIEKIPIIGRKIIESFKKAVETQIINLSDEELENIVYGVVKNEMRFIVWVGGILGFLIGLIQVAIILFL